MAAVHFVERMGNPRRLPDTDGEWESGYWHVSEESAARLIGGQIYLHSGQNEPSHFGGVILGYRVHAQAGDAQLDGRIVFRFRPSLEYKGVVTPREGWGNEKKLVW